MCRPSNRKAVGRSRSSTEAIWVKRFKAQLPAETEQAIAEFERGQADALRQIVGNPSKTSGAKPPWTSFVRVHERSGKVWQNSRYFVEVTEIPVETLDVPVIDLQIEANDHRPIHNWRDFQRIKDESSERKRRHWKFILRSPSSSTTATPTTCGPFLGATIFLPVCWVGGPEDQRMMPEERRRGAKRGVSGEFQDRRTRRRTATYPAPRDLRIHATYYNAINSGTERQSHAR